MPKSASCPALFISAPASGQGKTTLTAALARYHARKGLRVRIFKTGPDYLDPLILEQASHLPVEPLDLWMIGEDGCREALTHAALDADLILVEGAMGLFDGTPSSADIAALFHLDVVAVMNVKGMAQSVAAIAYGLAHYRSDIKLKGVVANQVGSPRHTSLIKDALPEETPLLATLPRQQELAMPSRHLGLIPPSEQNDLDAIIDAAADMLTDTPLAELPPAVTFTSHTDITQLPRLLEGHRIAVAKDAAFSFVYPANIRLLEALGARIAFFSPVEGDNLPQADALWLPGGYPELYADTLSAHAALATQITDFHRQNKPIIAECGGMLYLLESLRTLEGDIYPMVHLIDGRGEMHTRSGCQGMQSAPLPEGTFRGHAHHRSRTFDMPTPLVFGQRPSHPAPGEAIYRQGNLTASYIHLFFPSNPHATAALFKGETLTQVPLQQGQHDSVQ